MGKMSSVYRPLQHSNPATGCASVATTTTARETPVLDAEYPKHREPPHQPLKDFGKAIGSACAAITTMPLAVLARDATNPNKKAKRMVWLPLPLPIFSWVTGCADVAPTTTKQRARVSNAPFPENRVIVLPSVLSLARGTQTTGPVRAETSTTPGELCASGVTPPSQSRKKLRQIKSNFPLVPWIVYVYVLSLFYEQFLWCCGAIKSTTECL